MSVRTVSDVQRRARLGVRHALAAPVATPDAATAAAVALHATEPATVYLSCWARTADLTVDQVDRALYTQRTLVKQLAMRRTLWVFPRTMLPAVWPSASARVAAAEARRLAKELGDPGLQRALAGVLEHLVDHPAGLSARALREALPDLAEPGVVSRALTVLGAQAQVMRAVNDGHWRTARPRWTRTEHWLGETYAAWSGPAGYRALVRQWLYAFGPGTEEDIVWWLGATKAVVRDALTHLDAQPVGLESGAIGWLLPDDLEDVPAPDTWAALLPVLDPTTMGWKGRDFYLGTHRAQLFDRNGNAGTTAWVDGRVVGCWTQDNDGVVRVHLLESVTSAAAHALEDEAARLTAWLDGLRIGTVYPSPAMKAASG